MLISEKNIMEFIKETNNIEYYNPKSINYECPNVINIVDCYLIRGEIINLLMKNKNEQIKSVLNDFSFKYSILYSLK